MLSSLARLDIRRDVAEKFVAKYGVNEKLIRGEEVDALIMATPPIAQAVANVEKAQLNLARQRKVTDRGAGSVQELQNAENEYKVAVAIRDNAVVTARTYLADALTNQIAFDVTRQALEDTVIRAPKPARHPTGSTSDLSYAISRRQAAEGQMLKEGEAVYDLVIRDPLRLWASVPERYASEVKAGQPVRVRPASQEDEPVEGKVSRINPTVDPTSRTFQVETVIPNPSGKLYPGGFAKASILTRQQAEALVVPLQSIVRFAGVTKVFVADKGAVVREVQVEIGLEGRDWAEVTGALSPGDRVVTDGQTRLADGTRYVVRADEEEAKKKAASKPGESATTPPTLPQESR